MNDKECHFILSYETLINNGLEDVDATSPVWRRPLIVKWHAAFKAAHYIGLQVGR